MARFPGEARHVLYVSVFRDQDNSAVCSAVAEIAAPGFTVGHIADPDLRKLSAVSILEHDGIAGGQLLRCKYRCRNGKAVLVPVSLLDAYLGHSALGIQKNSACVGIHNDFGEP